MLIFPALDLYENKAVRLFQGDYSKMTIYSEDPVSIVNDFKKNNAKYLHLVDLQGARTGDNPNLSMIEYIVKNSDIFIEVGGGIRNMDMIEKYLNIGVDRVILGTVAVTNLDFLKNAILKYGNKIAVGVDIKDNCVAIKGWMEKSKYNFLEFCKIIENIGVDTIICTDISKDGAIRGSNHSLYEKLNKSINMNIIASGGVSSIEDVKKLKEMNLYGAIIGKAYYNKKILLKDAIRVAL